VATPTIAGITAGTIVAVGGVGGAVVGGAIVSAHDAAAVDGVVVINGTEHGSGVGAANHTGRPGGIDNRDGVAADGADSGMVIGTIVGVGGLGGGAFERIDRIRRTDAVFDPGRIGGLVGPIR
jgi:hypothetical protein